MGLMDLNPGNTLTFLRLRARHQHVTIHTSPTSGLWMPATWDWGVDVRRAAFGGLPTFFSITLVRSRHLRGGARGRVTLLPKRSPVPPFTHCRNDFSIAPEEDDQLAHSLDSPTRYMSPLAELEDMSVPDILGVASRAACLLFSHVVPTGKRRDP